MRVFSHASCCPAAKTPSAWASAPTTRSTGHEDARLPGLAQGIGEHASPTAAPDRPDARASGGYRLPCPPHPEVGRSGRASRPSAAGKPDRKAEAKTLGAIGVAVLLIVFAVVNSQKVEVDFLVATTHTPLVVALVVAMLLGFVLGNLTRRRTHRVRTPKA